MSRHLVALATDKRGGTPRYGSPSPWGAGGNLLPTEEAFFISPATTRRFGRRISRPHIMRPYRAPNGAYRVAARQYIDLASPPPSAHSRSQPPPHSDGEAILRNISIKTNSGGIIPRRCCSLRSCRRRCCRGRCRSVSPSWPWAALRDGVRSSGRRSFRPCPLCARRGRG